MEAFRIDLKTFWGLAMPNHYFQTVDQKGNIKLVLGRYFWAKSPSLVLYDAVDKRCHTCNSYRSRDDEGEGVVEQDEQEQSTSSNCMYMIKSVCCNCL